ncbi:MAG TPA: PASTA domain-containing protein [Gemmatimonadales bacterium]|nr:PASTA domain-containing protein [Gemmatimonadales bacterium]
MGALWPLTVKGRDRLRTIVILAGAVVLGYGATWVAYPAPLVPRDFAVGRLLGLPIEEAQRELKEQGFRLELEKPETDPVIPPGHVLWQDPPPGTALPKGAPVRLTISSGPAPVVVPDVIGFDLDAARQVVGVAGLRIGKVDSLVSATEAGVIIATRPATGSSEPPGTPVDLVVSRGAADIRVPDLLGIDQYAARDQLERAGLKVGTIGTRRVRRGPAGVVVDQRPAAGMLSPRGGRVNLVISQ